MEYVPEKAELDDNDEEFRKIFEKFSFHDIAGLEVKDLPLVFLGNFFIQYGNFKDLFCNSFRRMIKRMKLPLLQH